jgi:hypothetical protein
MSTEGSPSASLEPEAEESSLEQVEDHAPEEVDFPVPSKVRFKVGDALLCQWGPNLFHAKVLKIEAAPQKDGKESLCAYFVHYNGWSKRFDAWVEQEFVYDNTPENRDIQKSLVRQEKERKALERKRKQEIAFGPVTTDAGKQGAARTRGKKAKTAKRQPKPKRERVVKEKHVISDDVKSARSGNRLGNMSVNSRKEIDNTSYVENVSISLFGQKPSSTC